MPTNAELRSGFEIDLDYNAKGDGLAEFDAEFDSDEDHAGLIRAASPPPAVQSWIYPEPRMPRRRWPIFVPLAAAVVAASAVYGLAAQNPAVPALPSAPLSWAGRGAPLAAMPIPDVPEAPAPASAMTKTLPAPAEPTRGAIDAALAVVSHAYRALDAPSLRQVWPGADTAALSQQFSTLKYQSLSFAGCNPRPVGADQVVASCDVSIVTAANTGDPALRRRQESWSIVFNRSGDRYVIGSVTTR